VHLELIDEDDAANLSDPSVFDFTAADTVPPAKPGELGARITGES